MSFEETKKEKKFTASDLCQLNSGCMGCCGHSFENKDSIKAAIKKNTLEFESLAPKERSEFIAFRDRNYSYNLRSGVCRNLISSKCQIYCPLHPLRHEDKEEDMRLGHCDIHHLCKTAKKFKNWSDQLKEKFILFIKSKKLDNISYSLKMDDGSLLREFLVENGLNLES